MMTRDTSQHPDTDEITLVDFFVILAKRKGLFIGALLACFALGCLLVLNTEGKVTYWGTYLMPNAGNSEEETSTSAQIALTEIIQGITTDTDTQYKLYESITYTVGSQFRLSGLAEGEDQNSVVKSIMTTLLENIRDTTNARFNEAKNQLTDDMMYVDEQLQNLSNASSLVQTPGAQSSITSLTNQKITMEQKLSRMRPGKILVMPAKTIYQPHMSKGLLLPLAISLLVSLALAVLLTYVVDVYARAKTQIQNELT